MLLGEFLPTLVTEMNEIAEYLKSERLRQGRTIPEVSEETRVSVKMLEALEEGRYEQIGTELLIKSFIRAYAASLGVDVSSFLEKHAREIASCDQQQEAIKRFGRWSKNIYRKRKIGIFAVILIGIALFGVAYGVVWVWKMKEYHSASQSAKTSGYPQQDLPADLPEKSPESARTQVSQEAGQGKVMLPAPSSSPPLRGGEGSNPPASAAKPNEFPSGRSQGAGVAPADVLTESSASAGRAFPETKNHRFSVEADQKTWVQVTMDDKTTQNALLQPGEKREWDAEQGMRIVVGNAGGVRMKWNGKPVDVPAKSGSVIRFSLPDQRYVKE